jgi:hypothetical protein
MKNKVLITILAIIILIALIFVADHFYGKYQHKKEYGEAMTEISANLIGDHPEWENLPDTLFTQETNIVVPTGTSTEECILRFNWAVVTEKDTMGIENYHIAWFKVERIDNNANIKLHKMNYSVNAELQNEGIVIDFLYYTSDKSNGNRAIIIDSNGKFIKS